jgi:hypothetical protein
MYKGDKPEMDDYLLGKRIDRHIEKDEKPVGFKHFLQVYLKKLRELPPFYINIF